MHDTVAVASRACGAQMLQAGRAALAAAANRRHSRRKIRARDRMGIDDHSTSTDISAQTGWKINDLVIRLREWASERAYGLPDAPVEWKVGSATSCDLHLR